MKKVVKAKRTKLKANKKIQNSVLKQIKMLEVNIRETELKAQKIIEVECGTKEKQIALLKKKSAQFAAAITKAQKSLENSKKLKGPKLKKANQNIASQKKILADMERTIAAAIKDKEHLAHLKMKLKAKQKAVKEFEKNWKTLAGKATQTKAPKAKKNKKIGAKKLKNKAVKAKKVRDKFAESTSEPNFENFEVPDQKNNVIDEPILNQ